MKIQAHNTQRAAERAVEAELNRRGISTEKTDGNQPGIDLIAICPDNRLVPVEVKGGQGKPGGGNCWVKPPSPKDKDTLYVWVCVPTDKRSKPGEFQFFILTADEVDARLGASDKKWKSGLRWREVLPHENQWHKFMSKNVKPNAPRPTAV